MADHRLTEAQGRKGNTVPTRDDIQSSSEATIAKERLSRKGTHYVQVRSRGKLVEQDQETGE